MRSFFIIRFIALILCSAMVAEIGITVGNGDLISAEADSEMEHEEGNEDEKEKTTGGMDFFLPEGRSLLDSKKLATYIDPSWKSPSIDFTTPPPELS